MKRILFMIFTAMHCCILVSQSIYQKEAVITPNPIASSFKLYSDIPVSYSSGVPDIRIPIFTIQLGDFSLPIELRYHIRSLKPDNCRSNVALGWSLHFGGIVTRTVYGKPDEYSSFSNETYGSDMGTGNDFFLKDLYDRYSLNKDSEKDIFSYDINGNSGEFVIQNGNIPYHLGLHPIYITVNSGLNSNIGDISITNEDGQLFKFGYGNLEYSLGEIGNVYTTWNLNQIDLPSSQKVFFSYEDIEAYEDIQVTHNLRIIDEQTAQLYQLYDCGTDISICGDPIIEQNVNLDTRIVHEKNIKSIEFPNGKVEFVLSSDKRIINGVNIYEKTYAGSLRCLKKIEFVLDSLGSIGEMFLLRKVIELGALGDTINDYSFEYYDEGHIYENANTDFWGYYNGENDSQNWFPWNTYNAFSRVLLDACPNYPQQITYSYGESKESSVNVRKNVLKKIIYPTKGYTEFQYGLNRLIGSGGEKIGNGLRIEKIVTDDGLGNTIKKEYDYEPQYNYYSFRALSDFAVTTYSIGKFDLEIENNDFIGLGKYRTINIGAQVSNRIGHLTDVQYNKVSEIFGEGDNNYGKIIYEFSFENNHEYSSYYQIFAPFHAGYVGSTNYINTYKNWDNGLLRSKTIYKHDSLSPLKKYIYNYTYHIDTIFQNTHVIKICEYPGAFGDGDDSTRRECFEYQLSQSLPPIYGYYNYNIASGWLEKTSEIEINYFNNNPVVKTITYDYEGVEKHFPSAIEQNNSDNTLTRVEKKYPYDYYNPPFDSMVERNIISPTIEQKTYSNSTVVRDEKLEFDDESTTIFKPIRVLTKGKDQSAYEVRYNFNYDDKGNINSEWVEDGKKISYIWGYNQSYPVIKAENIEYSALATAVVSSLPQGFTCLDSLLISSNGIGNMSTPSQRSLWASFCESLSGQSSLNNAMLTLYTYSPLIGTTSQTDPNGVATYYEYDSAGRLKCIKDNDGNILKTYDYHYIQE